MTTAQKKVLRKTSPRAEPGIFPLFLDPGFRRGDEKKTLCKSLKASPGLKLETSHAGSEDRANLLKETSPVNVRKELFFLD